MKNKSNLLSALNAANVRAKTVADINELRAVIKNFDKSLATRAHELYGAEVLARKTARTEKNAARDAAFAAAKAAREDAKAKLAAARALVTKKPRKGNTIKAAAKFSPKVELIKARKNTPATTLVVDSMLGGLADLPAIEGNN